jgi:hypothetical protein
MAYIVLDVMKNGAAICSSHPCVHDLCRHWYVSKHFCTHRSIFYVLICAHPDSTECACTYIHMCVYACIFSRRRTTPALALELGELLHLYCLHLASPLSTQIQNTWVVRSVPGVRKPVARKHNHTIDLRGSPLLPHHDGLGRLVVDGVHTSLGVCLAENDEGRGLAKFDLYDHVQRLA